MANAEQDSLSGLVESERKWRVAGELLVFLAGQKFILLYRQEWKWRSLGVWSSWSIQWPIAPKTPGMHNDGGYSLSV